MTELADLQTRKCPSRRSVAVIITARTATTTPSQGQRLWPDRTHRA
jgi:hypothetical protein